VKGIYWLGLLGVALFQGFCINPCFAQSSQIEPDNTLGAESSLVFEDFQGLPIEVVAGGARRGINLFHSFREFNVREGRGAYFFSSNAEIQNILARVTGSNGSEILGTLGTFGSSQPNLFLINPNGILFGENASLDVGGSFVASTANGINLGETGFFSATEPGRSNLLAVNPSALFFNQVAAQPGNIINRGNLAVGKDFTLAGNNLDLQGRLFAGGDLNLQATDTVQIEKANAEGRNLDIQTNSLLLNNSSLVIDSLGKENPGNITVRANGDVKVEGDSDIATITTQGTQGNSGNINILAKTLSVSGISQIASASDGQGNAGNIFIKADDFISLSGNNNQSNFAPSTAIISHIERNGVGKTGNITIVTGSLSLDGAVISNSTFGTGNTGKISIKADKNISLINAGIVSNINSGAVGDGDEIKIDAESLSIDSSAIQSIVRGTFGNLNPGQGKSGNINVNLIGDLKITGNDTGILTGIITSVDTGAIGEAGDISITARDFFITAKNTQLRNAQVRSTLDASATGEAGNIDVKVRNLNIAERAAIVTGTTGQGNAGNISVEAADNVRLSGSSLISSGVAQGGNGNGGNIRLKATSLHITSGSQLQSSIGIPTIGGTENPSPTRGNAAGNIDINISKEAVFDGRSNNNGIRSGIRSSASSEAGTGGNITLKADSILIKNGARFSSQTASAGRAGDIKINARELKLLNDSGITTSTTRGGDSGNIKVNTNQLVLRDGSFLITDSLGNSTGKSGNLTVNATDFIEVIGTTSDGEDASGLYAQTRSSGKAGNLEINTGRLTVLNGGAVSTETSASGDGGNLVINATELIELAGGSPNQSFSSSINAGVEDNSSGNAGNVTITTKRLVVRDGASVSSSADDNSRGNSGNVTVNASESVEIIGRTPNRPPDRDFASGISVAVGAGSTGNTGNIKINTQRLVVRGGAGVLAQNIGNGQAGSILINAKDSVEVIGSVNNTSLINATVFSNAQGKTANVSVNTQRLSLRDGGQISATTFAGANAGDVTIRASDSIEIIGQTSDGIFSSGILARSIPFLAEVGGKGGDIEVQTPLLDIKNGGQISATAFGNADAGNININVDNLLNMKAGDISTTSTQSSGGNIQVKAANIRLFENSDITTFVGTGTGGGGNIALTANTILALDDSDILSFSGSGKGGDITFNTAGFFSQPLFRPTSPTTDANAVDALDGNNRVDVNASGTVNGAITGVPNITFIDENLTDLSTDQIDTNTLIANSCIARSTQRQENSFTITGSGGLRNSPGDRLVSIYTTGDVRNVEKTPRPWKKGDRIIEPTGVYKLSDGRLLLSRTC